MDLQEFYKKVKPDKQTFINIREVVHVSKINIISKIIINGNPVLQEDIPPEEFKKMLEKKMDEVMDNAGFDRIKTA